jgi:hypothetical protein
MLRTVIPNAFKVRKDFFSRTWKKMRGRQRGRHMSEAASQGDGGKHTVVDDMSLTHQNHIIEEIEDLRRGLVKSSRERR